MDWFRLSFQGHLVRVGNLTVKISVTIYILRTRTNTTFNVACLI